MQVMSDDVWRCLTMSVSERGAADNTGPAAGTVGGAVPSVGVLGPVPSLVSTGGFLSRGLAAGGRTRDT